MNAIEFLREYVEKQKILVETLVSSFGEDVDEFTFKAKLSRTIDALGGKWHVTAHGVGVRFTNDSNGEAIDAHVGLLDAPEIFDAWRIEEYVQSLRQKNTTEDSWSRIIELLSQKGAIKPHPTYRNHFVIVKAKRR